MVWGHNLQHMLFGATTSGFWMVFQSATLVFLTPDPFLEPQVQVLVPEGQGPLWGPKRGAEKHVFVEGLVSHEVPQDFLRGEWFLLYPGTLWVYQFPPKPSQGRCLHGFLPKP